MAQIPLHSPGVCLDPTSTSIGFCQVQGEETPNQAPGSVKPWPRLRRKDLQNGTEPPEGYIFRPTQPLLPLGRRPGNKDSTSPRTVTILTGRQGPRASVKHGPKMRAHGSFEAILGGRQLPECEEWGCAWPPVNFLNCHCRNPRWSTGHQPQNHGLARF